MPPIIEKQDGYEYTGPSGIQVKFSKNENIILEEIRKSDPEAATVVQYQPAAVSIPAMRLTLAKLGHMERIRAGLATLGDFDRELFEHGATCRTNGTLCTAIRDLAKMNEDQWRSVLVMTEAVEKAGLSD